MNKIRPITYNQAEEPWGKRIYSNCNNPRQTMASSGSAPTLCADIIATLKNKNVDPWLMAQLSMKWNCRTNNSGTRWNFFSMVAEYFGISKFIQSQRFEVLTDCIDAGGYVICSMKEGYWFRFPNYICAWNYDNEYVYAIDSHNNRKNKQRINDFREQSKMYFCFYPDRFSGGNDD